MFDELLKRVASTLAAIARYQPGVERIESRNEIIGATSATAKPRRAGSPRFDARHGVA